MNKGFRLIIFVLGLLSLGANAQNQTSIQFDKTIHDFGDIREADGPVSCEFIFKNTGQEPFTIVNVETSCGCTTKDYTKDPVKPGKTGFVKAIYDPKNYNGEFDKLITVTGNTNQGPLYLHIKGNILPRPRTILDEYPAQMGNLRFPVNHIVLGELNSDQLDTGFIKIYNSGNVKIKILGIKSPDHIWTKSLPTTIGPQEKIEIPFYFSAFRKNDIGYLFDRIQLLTDDVQMPDKELIVVVNIKKSYTKSVSEGKNAPKLHFEKLEHDFGSVKEGAVVEYEFKFKNEGIDPLIIHEIKSSCGCAGSTYGSDRVKGGESSVIKVTFNSKDKTGFNEKTLTVYTNDPVNPEIYLTIKAMVYITSSSK